MKIGILTLPLHTNYGGILQAYALQTVLERMGHEVHIIEKEKRPLSVSIGMMPFTYGRRIIKNLFGKKYPIFYEQKYNRELPIVREHTNRFIEKYIHLIKYKSFGDIKEYEYDAIVVGSDQVWRPKYFGKKQIEQAYLKFAEDWKIKRIAYATSFGTDEWKYTRKQTSICGSLLRKFDAVSVREDSGVDLCKKYFGAEAQHVLDPTMLLNIEDYIKLFEANTTPKSQGDLLYYFLNETDEKKEFIKRVAKEKGLTPFNVKSKSNDINSPISDRIQPPVEQWLRGFYDAEFVVADSFHACVFAIIFKKQFVVIGNIKRGMSRFESLLKIFDLDNRLIDIKAPFQDLGRIDYDLLYKKYDSLRLSSIMFLSNSL